MRGIFGLISARQVRFYSKENEIKTHEYINLQILPLSLHPSPLRGEGLWVRAFVDL